MRETKGTKPAVAARVYDTVNVYAYLYCTFHSLEVHTLLIKMPKVKAEKKSRQHQEVKSQGSNVHVLYCVC